tara:strand:+ start:7188 stop:8333 length:1146 start_codon:yes stop_codon:yes gene_type:complete
MTINRNEYYVRPVNGNDSTGDGLSHATAWLTTVHAMETITIDLTDGDRINICDEGTDTLTGILPFSTYGSHTNNAAGIVFEGYTATAGDGGIFTIDGNGYPITPNLTDGDFITFQNGKITNWGQWGFACQIDDYCFFVNMEFDGTKSGTNCSKALSLGSYCHITGCKFHNLSDTSAGCIYVNTGGHIVNNYIEASANPVVRLYTGLFVTGNIIINSRSSASECIEFRNGREGSVRNNTLIRNGGGTGQAIGVYHTDAIYSSQLSVINNYIEGYSGVGAKGVYVTSGAGNNYVSNNYYHNCTTAEDLSGSAIYERKGPTILSPDSGLIDWANGDFRPVKALIGEAETSQFLTTGTTRSVDVGAVQRARGAIGGPNMQAGRAR